MFQHLADFDEWFDRFRRDNEYRVTRTPLDRLAGWGFDPDTGDLRHETGKFFSVQGLRVRTDHREVAEWSQPIIVQPEIGILGIVVRIVDGRVQCLMNAKMEPGNVNTLQLSPTVQATRSNYTQVHRGSAVPYLGQFVAPRGGRVVFDALQSEQGSWFLHKRNRNMIVQVQEDLPVRDGYCWLDLDQISALLERENLVNMDARTVLSGMPFLFAESGSGSAGPFADHVGREGDEPALHSVEELLSWFTEAKSRYYLERSLVPMAEVEHWERAGGSLAHESGKFFSVMGVDVTASSREVRNWSQPMIEPCARGVIAFVGRRINGVFHVLVQARTEAGTQDVVEMSPTVNCIPANYAGDPPHRRPRFLDVVLGAPVVDRVVDVVHSEEGGRFFHAENHYIVVDVGEDFDLHTREDYCWMTVRQLTRFVRYGSYVNVAARCLLTCLAGESVRLTAIGL